MTGFQELMASNGRREQASLLKERQRPLAFLLVLLLALLLLTWLMISYSQDRLIEFKSLQTAEVVATQATSARSVYSQSVVAKLRRDGFGASTSSDQIPGAVPIPAQFLKNLSHQSSEQSNGQYRYRPLSKWNMSPDQGLKDGFQFWAWSELEKQNYNVDEASRTWEPVWRIEENDDGKVLRYLYPDPASGASCVNCHNALEKQPEIIQIRMDNGVKPGRVWKLNDLMGALEVTVPLKKSSEFAATQTRNGLFIFSGVTLVGLMLVAAFTVIDAFRTRTMTRKLEHQATHDFLTSLPNRSGFELSQQTVLETHDLNDTSHAIMLLDLNDFKRINDTLGHEVGDGVLVEAARRLQTVIGDNDLVARLGGDEFAVLLTQTNRQRAADIAAKLTRAFDQEFVVDSYRLQSRASIGIAMMPDDATESKEALRCADVARYISKKGRIDHSFYNSADDKNHLTLLAVINDFRTALQNDRLSLVYQPKFDLNLGVVSGVEGLLRWVHPEHGAIAPDEIVPIAERCGLISELTAWSLRTGLRQLTEWLPQYPQLTIAVNLSARMLNDQNTVGLILKCLDEAGLTADKLTIEVTESSVMVDPECAERILAELDEAGVVLSIDDFGTGYSSLSYLHRLPVKELKLDQSFVKNLSDGGKDSIIVSATVELARELGLQIVAEGVENQHTLDWLCRLECDTIQGFYLCRPKSATELTARFPGLNLLASTIAFGEKKHAA